MTNHPCCEDCHWFMDQERGLGTCHRYPPIFAGESAAKDYHHWKFPIVTTHAWCGEFAVEMRAPGQ
jgi:hypothetical protein